ncbi:MAG TPA: Gfo/Idh/MocA family oxidoreductase [bacterium]|nr:Gfo/Idh/MocA family oxidoreductase [bacterium]HPR86534.1 Gfo/Idh/MocA family oxidoreductase [bacterium]
MNKIRMGIAGVGKLGTFHCNTLSQMPEADLVGLYDLDPERARESAERFRCKTFSSYAEMLEQVDAVGIAVPTTLHHSYTLPALAAGKAVFVEKPIAASIDEAAAMAALAAEKQAILQVGHIERFNPAIRALEHLLPDPRFIESHRLAPFDPRGTDVAVVLDLMIHDIDIILSLVPSEVSRIDASGVAVVSEEVDIANARLQFANGCVANVTASRISQRKMRKMRLFQRDAYISIDFLQRLSEVFRIVAPEEGLPSTVVLGQIDKGSRKRHIIYEQPQPPEGDAMRAEWQAFLAAVRDHTRPIVNGEDGLKALQVAEEITRIIAQNTL